MMYDLILKNNDDQEVIIKYDPHTSYLCYENGTPVFDFSNDNSLVNIFNTPVNKISPSNPGKKISKLRVLKIQMGLQCNFSCTYCSQATEVKSANHTNLNDAKTFMKNLDSWLTGQPTKIEFWGGEPLLYWKKIKFLLEELNLKFPSAQFLIITNGSLISEEFIEYVQKYNIFVGISHDGPGQHLRGPDPLENKNTFDLIKKLVDIRSNKMSFNCVLTSNNNNLSKIQKFFDDKFQTNVRVSTEGAVAFHTDSNQKELVTIDTFTQEQYQELMRSLFLAVQENKYHSLMFKENSFLTTIKYQISSNDFGQICGMDRTDTIAVDLLGNVMTCHNTGAKGKHKIGHVNKLSEVKLDTSLHWSHREECSSCPVLQLCQGSCMYLEGSDWYHSCNNSYYYSIGILAGILYKHTGMTLMEIRGDIIRPTLNENLVEKIS